MSIVLSRFRFVALLLLFLAGAWLTHSRGRVPSSRGFETSLAAQQPTPASSRIVAGEAAAHARCATCHKLPPPLTLPRSSWRDEIARMFLIVRMGPA